jgi:hypothetical protein
MATKQSEQQAVEIQKLRAALEQSQDMARDFEKQLRAAEAHLDAGSPVLRVEGCGGWVEGVGVMGCGLHFRCRA